MPKAVPIQTSFNAGEFSPLMRGQVTFDKRGDALELCQNLIPVKQGPVVRRGGTVQACEVKDSSKRSALIEYKFSSSQAYIIEVGDRYMRFITNYGVVTGNPINILGITNANPAVLNYAGADDPFANGDEVFITGVSGMTQINNKYYKVASVNTSSNTFQLQSRDGVNINSTAFGTYTSGGTVAEVYEIATPYLQADLFDANGVFLLHFVQNASVIYITHEKYKTRTLVRVSNNNWTLNTVAYNDGPFLDQNATTVTLALSGTSGSVTVTASSASAINNGSGFLTTDVGRIIRWRDNANNWTWLTITAYTSSTQVTATISGPNASSGTATTQWRMGTYSDTTGWPRTCTFVQNRFAMAGNTATPDRYDLTESAAYSPTILYFAPTNAAGTVGNANAISGSLPSNEVNRIQWMAGYKEGLVIGTSGQEWTLRATANDRILAPGTAVADPASTNRSEYIQPILASQAIIFVQSARRKMFDYKYVFQDDNMAARDLTILAEHITESGIIDIIYQQEPINAIWAVTKDGLLLNMIYYPDENVYPWSRHPIGGYADAGKTEPAVVESISAIPSPDGSKDDLWMIVRRNINGVTRRYIEYMTHYYDGTTDLQNCKHMDSALTYSGSPTNVVTGLEHLEGQTVRVMRDGRAHPLLTVTNGSITLANGRTGSVINVGLACPWALKTMTIEAGAANGTAQGKSKRITKISLNLLNSLLFYYGASADGRLDQETFNQGAIYDQLPVLFSGNKEVKFPNGNDTYGYIYLTHDDVFPFCCTSISPQVVTQDD